MCLYQGPDIQTPGTSTVKVTEVAEKLQYLTVPQREPHFSKAVVGSMYPVQI